MMTAMLVRFWRRIHNDRYKSVQDDLPALPPPDRGSIKPFWQTTNFSRISNSDMSIHVIGIFGTRAAKRCTDVDVRWQTPRVRPAFNKVMVYHV